VTKKPGQKNLRSSLTQEELERIERAAAHWKATGNLIGELAEMFLSIYREHYADSAHSAGQDVETVSGAREVARDFMTECPPCPDDFAQARIKEYQSIAEDYGLNSYIFSMWLGDREQPFHAVKGLRVPERGIERLVAADFIERDIPLPPPLRSYIVGVLRQPLLPSDDITQRRRSKAHRDKIIANTLARVTFCYPQLKPTRNRTQRDSGAVHSVCSIVSEVLGEWKVNLSEDAVEKVWAANRKGFAKMNEARREGILSSLSRLLKQADEEAETTTARPSIEEEPVGARP
jgi:hypothetical protein